MAHEVTLIPGDGTGPELIEATRRVLEATGVEFEWDEHPAGEDVYNDEGTQFPDRTLDSVKRTGVGIKGPTTTPVGANRTWVAPVPRPHHDQRRLRFASTLLGRPRRLHRRQDGAPRAYRPARSPHRPRRRWCGGTNARDDGRHVRVRRGAGHAV